MNPDTVVAQEIMAFNRNSKRGITKSGIFIKYSPKPVRNPTIIGNAAIRIFRPMVASHKTYEEEQKELSEKIKKLRSEIEKQNSRAASTDMFVSIVRKYTRARKLTPRMLNELVEKIEVYNAERIDGEWVQRLRIHYNCVGEMNIPNEPALPIPAVTVNTRKGVFVSYTTDDRPAV